MKKITEDEKNRVKEMYDCDENPLTCQIKPKGTFDIRESREIKQEDLQN